MRVLLVEDERSLARIIEMELRLQNMSVAVCGDCESALAKAYESDFDLVILDWMLPDREGIYVCRAIRNRGSQVPIIMITAKQGVADEVRGLAEGADDYIVKPFDMELLIARIKAVTRRISRADGELSRITVGAVTIEPPARAVYDDGRRVHLTNKEYEILTLLMANRGSVVTKERIRAAVWGENIHLDEGAIAVHVKAIRDKVKGLDIANVRGVGYMVEQSDCGL